MLKEKIIKTPLNSKKKMIKNLSCNNYDSKGNIKTIFKLRERLFSPNSLSLLSNKNYNLSRNFLNLWKSPTLKIRNKKQIKKCHFKSYDNNKNEAIYPYTQTKSQKISFSTIETRNKMLTKTKQSYLNLNDINKRNSQIILPKPPPSFMRRIYESPKKYTQINKILKFNLIKKKEEIQKDLSPMQLGKEYSEFIEKKNKLFFNPNFDSPYIHKMSANYMLDKDFLKNYKPGFDVTKVKQKIKAKINTEDIELELRDKIEDMSLELKNYQKEIKNFLTDEIKLNQIYIHEDFFNSFVNKINFLYDDRKFPTIKNNLSKIKVEIKTAGGYEWNRLNMIEISTLKYLHKLKAKIQRELDEIEEENKERQFNINQQIGKYDYKNIIKKRKKRKSENKMNESEKTEESKSINIENKNFFNFLENDSGEDENEEEKKIEKKEDLYEFEEFFVHKGNPYKNVDFATGKLAYTIYNNPKFYRKFFKKNEYIKENKGMIKNKKEFDLYL